MYDRHALLRHARERAGLVAREVAYRIDTDANRVYGLEAGRLTVTEDVLQRYADAELITREERIAALLGETPSAEPKDAA